MPNCERVHDYDDFGGKHEIIFVRRKRGVEQLLSDVKNILGRVKRVRKNVFEDVNRVENFIRTPNQEVPSNGKPKQIVINLSKHQDQRYTDALTERLLGQINGFDTLLAKL